MPEKCELKLTSGREQMKPLIKSRSSGPGNAQSPSTLHAAAVVAAESAGVGFGRAEAASSVALTSSNTNIGRAKLLLINFFRTTSVHGFVNAVQVGVHFVERILWFFCIGVAIFGALSLSQRVWHRYNSSPTVIAMDRNKFFWNTTFPSLTLCPHSTIDDNKLRLYFEANAGKFPRAEDRAAFKAFVHKLSNATFETFNEVPSLSPTLGIPAEDYMELLHNLTLHFNPDITSGTSHKLHMTETVTEIGVCFAVNSRVAAYNSFSVWRANRWTAIESPETVVVHPFDGEIYANIINISTSYDVFFHAAHEVPDISKQQRYSFSESDYTTVELEALEITTSRDARALRISQRKCRFTEEARNLVTSPVYSFIICRMECRLKLALRLCNCIPHFYRTKGKDGRRFRVCDFQGMQCLYRNRNDLLSLQPTKTTEPGQMPQHEAWCECDRNCDDSNFFVQNLRSRVWFLGANLQFGLNNYPKMQLRRNVLFRFEDLLAYIGSTAGLFLGCSLLSFTEFIYFFTWRFVKLVFLAQQQVHTA